MTLVPVLVLAGCQPQSAVPVAQEHGMEQYANDPKFHAAHTLRDSSGQEHKGKEIEIAAGESKAKAYWDAPKDGHDQAVLMIHEWWGLNDNVRDFADMLRDKTGYGVLAIDLYEGKVAKDPTDAGKYMAAVDNKKASATVNAALRALKDGTVAKSGALGTIGFCFGGGWSHKAAIMGGDNVKACVIFYGLPTTAPGELERLKAPVFMVWGNKDGWINKKVVDGFKSAMATAGKSLETSEFNADHAFANPSSKSYNSKDAEEAWSQAISFLKKNLD